MELKLDRDSITLEELEEITKFALKFSNIDDTGKRSIVIIAKPGFKKSLSDACFQNSVECKKLIDYVKEKESTTKTKIMSLGVVIEVKEVGNHAGS